MSKRHENMLGELREMYEPLDAFYGKELNRVEALTREYEQTKDPMLRAFRENPVAQKLFRAAAASYKHSKLILANDDGSLDKEDRIRLHVATLWAAFYIRAFGGDPEKMRDAVESEIEKMATESGIELSTTDSEE